MAIGVHRMENYRKLKSAAKEVEPVVKDIVELSGRIHMHRSRAPCHSKRAYQPHQSKAMVAMQMRDEDMREF